MEIDNEHGGGICKQLPLDGISGHGVFYSQLLYDVKFCIQCKIYNILRHSSKAASSIENSLKTHKKVY